MTIGPARESLTAVMTDAELLARIAAGDLTAVGAIYDRYAATMFPVALRILRNRSEAEDVLHDAFVLVGERAGQYVPDRGTVAAWLVTLVRNLAIDRTRRRDRRAVLGREVLAHEPTEAPLSPEAQVVAAAESARLRAVLAILPEAQRATLEVAFFEGLTYPEIAAREGVPLGTIKSRAARAMATLREALEGAAASPTAIAKPQKP